MQRHLSLSATILLVACGAPHAPTAPPSDDGKADAACAYHCADYGYEPSQCFGGWQCDSTGDCLAYVGSPTAPTECPSPANGGSGDIGAPRPIAPASRGSILRSPTFRWELASGSDGALVRVCRDRALTTGCNEFTAAGSSGRPLSGLANGVWFWQLRGTSLGTVGSATSATWEFRVGAAQRQFDFNGDGFSDVVLLGSGPGTNVLALFLGGPSGPPNTPSSTLTPPVSLLFVADAGDVNGDGCSDLLAVSSDGTARLFLGQSSGVLPSTYQTISAPVDRVFRVGGAGDLNGDGFDDVVVSTSGSAHTPGHVALYLGSASGLAASPAATLSGDPSGLDGFGTVVNGVGDVDGDGYSDVVVGGQNSNLGGTVGDGSAWLIKGAPTLSSYSPSPTWNGGKTMQLGAAVLGVDFDGDGYSDVILDVPGGTTDLATGGVKTGATIDLYDGAASGPSSSPSRALQSPGFGVTAIAAGDVDGDGLVDLIAGNPSGRDGQVDVYLASRPAPNPVTLLAPGYYKLGAASANILFGTAVACADVNGDGYDDVIVGGPGGDAQVGNAAYVFLGGPGGPDTTPLTLRGPIGYGGYGQTLAQ